MAFEIFDHDGEGEISVDECGRVMKVLGQDPDAEQLAEIVAEVDVDGKDGLSRWWYLYQIL